MRVAVYGAHGFVGSQIVKALRDLDVEVVEVTRRTYLDAPVVDVAVNAACPGARLRAEMQPRMDYRECVEKTADMLYWKRWTRFVQISSLSARTQLDTVYGRHRLAAEALCAGQTIVRLGPMYGEGLVKGSLVDMLAGRMVYAHPDTKYGYAPVEWIGRRVAQIALDPQPGTIELAGTGWVTLLECAAAIGSPSTFDSGRRPDDQWVDWPTFGEDIGVTLGYRDPDVPPASAVLDWLKAQKGE